MVPLIPGGSADAIQVGVFRLHLQVRERHECGDERLEDRLLAAWSFFDFPFSHTSVRNSSRYFLKESVIPAWPRSILVSIRASSASDAFLSVNSYNLICFLLSLRYAYQSLSS